MIRYVVGLKSRFFFFLIKPKVFVDGDECRWRITIPAQLNVQCTTNIIVRRENNAAFLNKAYYHQNYKFYSNASCMFFNVEQIGTTIKKKKIKIEMGVPKQFEPLKTSKLIDRQCKKVHVISRNGDISRPLRSTDLMTFGGI